MKKTLITLLALLTLAPAAEARSLSLSRITAYNPVAAQTDATPGRSACGRTFPGQIAVSRDLRRAFPCGSLVRVTTASGRVFVGRVNDTMAARWSRSVDVMVNSGRSARHFGVQRGRIERL